MEILELFKRKLSSVDGSSSKNTVKNYVSDVRHFIAWFEATTDSKFEASSITPDVLSLYQNSMGGALHGGNVDLSTQLSVPSMKRHLSSIRKFFTVLEGENIVRENPFTKIVTEATIEPTDYWHLKSFKDYLGFTNASKITIKNYLSDIQGFARWYEEAILPSIENPLSSTQGFYLITQEVIENYRKRLSEIQNAAPRTINRKLSALRRYLEFATKKGFITSQEITFDSVSLAATYALENEPKISLSEITSSSVPLVRKYSIFPPLRLIQKLLIFPYLMLEDKIATGIAILLAGKQLIGSGMLPQKLVAQLAGKTIVRAQNQDISSLLGVRNVQKEFYAPDKMVLLGMPIYQRAIHHFRFTRPDWYKKYHNYAFVHYVHFALLIIFAAGVGVALYSNLVVQKSSPTFAAPVAPPRILSFQGRLTDNLDNPVTSTTDVRFAIYNSSVASGAALLWQEQAQVGPDQDGIFSVLLGSSVAIPSTVFSDNSSIYLGVSIKSTSELTPRQRIASVGYASNSEFLQGLPPTSAVSSFVNAVLALDSTGSFNLNDGIEHTFQVSNATLTLKAQTLNLTTSLGTSGNVIINPDGLGKVDIQKPIINNSNTGNLVRGGVEVNDRFGVLATESAVAAFIVNNDTTGGDIFAASSSATTRFKIANDGTLTSAIYTGQNGVLFGTQTTGVIAQATTASSGLCLQSGAANPTWASCGTSYWTLTNGALAPYVNSLDLLIGGQSTASAKFGFINNAVGSPTATISGNLSLVVPTGSTGSNLFNIFNGGTLNFQTSPGGDPGLASRLFIANDGRVGIGTITPSAKTTLDVRGTNGTGPTASISAKSSFAALVVDNSGGGDLFSASASGVSNFIIKNNGDIYIGQDGLGKITAGVIDPYLIQNQKTSGTQSLTFQTLGASSADFIFKNTSTTLSTLTMAGQFQLPVTGSTGGIVLGGDTQLFRGAADRIDVAANDSINFLTGTGGLLTNGTTRIDSSGNGTFANLVVSGGCTGCGATGPNSPFQTLLGAIVPLNSTLDFLLGGQATSSAKFAVLNINSGTPVASVSAQNAGAQALVLGGDGSIQSVRNNTLTIGGGTTGSLVLAGTSIQLSATSPIIDLTSASTLSLNTTTNRPITTGTGLTTLGGNLTVNGATTSLASTAITLTGSSPIIDLSSGTTLSINTTTNRPITTGTGLTTLGGNLTVAGATTTFSNAAPILTSNTNTDLTITPNGSGNLILTSNFGSGVKIGASTNTFAPLSVSGGIGSNALAIFNQINGTDILAASASGTTKFTIKNDGTASSSAGFTVDGIGNIQSTRNQTLTLGGGSTGNLVIGRTSQTVTLPGFTTNGGIIYTTNTGVLAQTGAGSATQCLLGGGGTPAFGSCTTGVNSSPFYDIPSLGIIVQGNTTEDFLLGGVATTSAKFAILGIAGTLTPTASVSAQNALGQALVLGGDGSIQSVRNNTLTIGGTTTGKIQFQPGNSTSSLSLSSNGFVGIGISDPTEILHLYKSTGNFTTARFDSAATQGYFFSYDGDNSVNFGSNSNSTVNIKTNNTTKATLLSNGLFGIGATSPVSELHVTRPLSFGATGKALAIFDQIENQDILTASLAGVTKFTIKNDGTASSSAGFTVDGIGNIQSTRNQTLTLGGGSTGNLVIGRTSQTVTLPGFTTNGGIIYTTNTGVLAQTGAGSATQCLLGGGGTPAFGSCTTGVNSSPFYDIPSLGIIVQGNTTEDFLAGGVGSASAAFKVTGQGNPFAGTLVGASVSANTSFAGLVVDNRGLGDLFAASSSGINRFVITQNGNVGIGTSMPSQLLALAGGNFQINATNPTIKGNLNNASLAGAIGVYIQGHYAYVIGEDRVSNKKLTTIDITNPTTPVITGTLNDTTNLNGVNSIVVSGKYAYMTASTSAKLIVADISNPFAPIYVSSISDTVRLAAPSSVYVAGKYAYVTASGSASLTIVDISSATSPVIVGTVQNTNFLKGAQNVFVSGKYAYVTSFTGSGLAVIDIGNPYAPTIAGNITDAANLNSVAQVYVSGRYAYVVGRNTNKLTTVDVSNPNAPVITNTLTDNTNLTGATSISVAGRYAYITASIANKLTVVDISTPASPVVVGSVTDATTLNQPTYVYISGKYAYVTSFSGNRLTVVDINGADLPAANIGNLASNYINVSENAEIGNNLFVRNAVNIGNGGLFSQGGFTFDTASGAASLLQGAPIGNALLTLNYQGSTQNIFTASTSGVTKFAIGNDGQTMVGNLAADPTTAIGTGSIYYNTSSQALKFYNGTSWNSILAGTVSPFGVNLGAIVPGNTTYDFLLGATATTSAQFSVLGIAAGTSPTASVSATSGANAGNGISLGGDGSIQSLRNNTLTIGGNTTGAIAFRPNNIAAGSSLYLSGGGNVGIGNANPVAALHITGAGPSIYIANSGQSISTQLFLAPGADNYLTGSQTGDSGFKLHGSTGGFLFGITNVLVKLTRGGNLGIGTINSPTGVDATAALQVYSTSFTAPAASISAQNTPQTALLVTKDGGLGNIIEASYAGIIKFQVDYQGNVGISGNLNGGLSDFAEYFKKADASEQFAAGQLICIGTGGATKCNSTLPSSQKILGVISDNALLVGNGTKKNDPKYVLVGLVGQLGVQSDTTIKKGDPLTFSSISGVATKAVDEGNIIGFAMEDNNTGKIHRVATAFQSNYYNPNVALHNTSYFNTLSLGIANGIYTIYDALGNSISHIDAFSKAIIGTLQAGLIQARSIVTDTFTATSSVLGNASASTLSVAANTITIGGQSLQDIIASTVHSILASQFLGLNSGQIVSPLSEIDTLRTNLISPLASGGNVTVAGKLVVAPSVIASDSAAIALEVHGSASISGNLATNSIETNNATISGTLYAGNIAGLDSKLATLAAAIISSQKAVDNSQQNASSSSYTASSNLNSQIVSADTIHANFGIFEQGITSMGPITSNIITATDQLAVGTSFTISNNAINTIGTDLEIQSLRQGNISFEGGLIRMDADGNMSVNGNLNLLGEIDAVHGVFSGTLTAHALATDLISPVADSNISLSFADSKFNIHNSKTGTGSAVLTIDNQGNVKSSGSATFGRLNFNLVGKAEATSLTEAVATGSAGFATLRQGQPELTIKNNLITSKSLIYITPFGDTDNKVLYLLRQVPNIDQDGVPTPGGSFTVGISGSPAPREIQFNWLIIN